MTFAPQRSWALSPRDLSLPRWAFVAWFVQQRQADMPRPTLALSPAGDIEASRRARLLRELVPQDV